MKRSGWLVLVFFLAASLGGCSRNNTPPPEETSTSSTAEVPPPEPIDPATAGEITGQALFEGQIPARVQVVMNAAACAEANNKEPVFREDLVVNDNKTLRDVFVYVKEGLGNRRFAAPAEPVMLDQKGCWFRPHVLGLMVGQKLEIKNNDNVSHNIHPVPRVNREWNESMSPGAADLFEQFALAEVMIPVRCNVHQWMRAYIGVVSSPFFAVTDDQGAFTLKGLPPGSYTIEAWQEKLGVQDQKVVLGPKEVKTIQFSFRG
jgi:plastocyanin